MKELKVSKTTLLVGLLLLSFAGAFRASASSPDDPSIQPFWNKFKTAVQQTDKAFVAALSQFPIEMPYGIAKIRNRAQMTRRWRDLFSVQANAVKCFADAQPVIDTNDRNRFTVGCKDAAGFEVVVYGFVRTKSGWKFNSLDNLNE